MSSLILLVEIFKGNLYLDPSKKEIIYLKVNLFYKVKYVKTAWAEAGKKIWSNNESFFLAIHNASNGNVT